MLRIYHVNEKVVARFISTPFAFYVTFSSLVSETSLYLFGTPVLRAMKGKKKVK